MAEKNISGKITFIHHDKNRAVIEYLVNDRKKTIQADINPKKQTQQKEAGLSKKQHRFLVGDQVTFTIKKTGANGSILYADSLEYKYNTALELLINKARVENRFLGYIKETDNAFYIKEIESYLFFPLKISKYELPPDAEHEEKPVQFKLEHTDTPEKIVANLYNHHYIPEFLTAVQHYKKKMPVTATVTKVSPYGIYLSMFKDKIQSKLTTDQPDMEKAEAKPLITGTSLQVLITHLSPDRIVVERVPENS